MAKKENVAPSAPVTTGAGLSEEQILKMMKQDQKRKEYQTTPKAIANRKQYQIKHQAEQKAARDFMKDLKTNNPDEYARLMAKATNVSQIITGVHFILLLRYRREVHPDGISEGLEWVDDPVAAQKTVRR